MRKGHLCSHGLLFFLAESSLGSKAQARTDNQPIQLRVQKRQGMNIMDAVSTVKTLERFMWSGARKSSKGQYTQVYHFNSKAEATQYLRTAHPETWDKTSVITVSFYLDNALRAPLIIPRKVYPHAHQSAILSAHLNELTVVHPRM